MHVILAMAVALPAVGVGPYGRVAQAAPVGQGFTLNASDLRFIMQQIRIAERHAATLTPANPCGTLVGDDPDQLPTGTGQTIELPWGLRTVDGSCNHLTPGQETFGAADQVFPRLVPMELRGDYAVAANVTDPQPRIISNLIVDQTSSNPAAVEVSGLTGAAGETLLIPNVATDAGLSAPFNSWFTFFGQFFDHGLDLVNKGGNGTVFMPLQPDDPLFVQGAPTNFMVMSRVTHGGDFEGKNQTSPFVDQSQTYSSHPSHQVFLRYYNLVNGVPVPTGHLMVGPGNGMATWLTAKIQARTKLGILLRDIDALSVPLLATDPYGQFIPGPNGLPQMVKIVGGVRTLVEGNLATPITTADAVPSGHAFLDDIAHHAVPAPGRTPDADTVAGPDDGLPGTYDNELLNAHFMAGDGRANENIGLTAVHHVFHSEHNRLVGAISAMITGANSVLTPDEVTAWQATTGPAGWNYGVRLFQAARFVTEMEYQHLAFEEFARKIQPLVNPFGEGGTGFHPSINPAITAEFSHAAYRLGHSMLNEEIERINADGSTNNISLLDAFLNPTRFFDGFNPATDPQAAKKAAGAIIRGSTLQIGNQIDEFVTDTLRNSLLGLPLDLPALNIARGRDTGLPRLNQVRRDFFAASLNSALAPYTDWEDFGFSIRNQASLVNFIAAYGTHPTITAATTNAARRSAAAVLLAPGSIIADAGDFLRSQGAWARVNGRTVTGVDDIDLWIGGLAEKPAVFGGMLGATLNFIFEIQMEDLQDGDRFYYLSRTAGLNLLTQLEGNSFAELIQRNTDVEGLPADAFSRPAFLFKLAAQTNPSGIVNDPSTVYDETTLLIRRPDGTIRYTGLDHVVFDGSAANDRMWTSEGDDTLRGNDGNDWLDGGDGNDNLIGGNGNDILFGGFGDDVLKGGNGNDVLSSGQGFGGDLNQGGYGHDYIIGGNDLTESFAGPGNDFVFAGDDSDTVFGDDGDDWIEGGGGAFNLLQGDNGAPFQNDLNTPGHDVIIGYGGEQDYDMEGGDDIGLLGPGIQRVEGMNGFDWATHKLDPTPGDSDMRFTVLLPPTVEANRDRFDRVEGLSGWIHNDILRGDDRGPADLAGGDELLRSGRSRIIGLNAIVPAGVGVGDPVVFQGGNILLGGPGSDILEGRGGNDIIDGDRWLDVQIRVVGTRPAGLAEFHDGMATLNAAVVAGEIEPGQLRIVRAIRLADPNPLDVDVAVFSGARSEYTITRNPSNVSVIFVNHVGGAATDGVDRLRNIEILRFQDQDIQTVDIP